MKTDINNALQILKKGGIILYPTDTIWGLGCDATNYEAVDRVYKIKQRSDSKSMLVLLDNSAYLSYYVKEVPEVAYQLIEVSDKPITIIYPGAQNLSSNLIADDGSVGIRISSDDFCRQLISKFRKPIVSTSANVSGQPSPGNFSEIDESIKSAVDYIVEYRQDDFLKSQPSSILQLGIGGQINIIRK